MFIIHVVYVVAHSYGRDSPWRDNVHTDPDRDCVDALINHFSKLPSPIDLASVRVTTSMKTAPDSQSCATKNTTKNDEHFIRVAMDVDGMTCCFLRFDELVFVFAVEKRFDDRMENKKL
jgi:hypothetical protein